MRAGASRALRETGAKPQARMSSPMRGRVARRLVAALLAVASSLGALSPSLAALGAPSGRDPSFVQPVCTSAGLEVPRPEEPRAPSLPAHRHSDACPLCAACASCAPGPRGWLATFAPVADEAPATVGARPMCAGGPRLAAQPRAPPPRA